MPKQDKLFSLIKSLNKSEKRYFSIYTQMHVKGEDNDYMKLFKEFEKQDVLDEDQIKDTLKNEKLMDHYAVIKSYLYDLILKAMRSYSKHSASKKILDLLEDVEFLYSKGIFDQAMQLVKKAKDLAISAQKYGVLEEVMSWEKMILQADGFYGISDEGLKKMYEDQALIGREMSLENQLWKTCADLFNYYYTHGKTRKKEFANTYGPMVDNDHEIPLAKISTVKTYYYYFLRKIYFHYIKGDTERSLEYVGTIIHYFEESEERISEYPYLYTYMLSMRLDMEIEAELFEKAEATINKISGLENIIRINNHHEAWAFVTTGFGRLMFFRKQKFIHSALQMIPDLEKGLKKYNPFISSSRYMEFQYLFGIIHFKSKNFKKAEEYFDNVLNSEKDYRQDIHAAAMIMKIIINYEQGQARKVNTLIEKTITYLQQKNKMHEFESVLLNYLRLLGNVDDRAEEKSNFKALQDLLKKIGEVEFERNAFLFEDIQSWIMRKSLTNTNIFYSTNEILNYKSADGIK